MIGCLSTATASPVLEHDCRISGDVFPQRRNEGPRAVISRSSGGGAQDNHQGLTLIKGRLRQSAVSKNCDNGNYNDPKRHDQVFLSHGGPSLGPAAAESRAHKRFNYLRGFTITRSVFEANSPIGGQTSNAAAML
jgi:hypothetical protein